MAKTEKGETAVVLSEESFTEILELTIEERQELIKLWHNRERGND